VARDVFDHSYAYVARHDVLTTAHAALAADTTSKEQAMNPLPATVAIPGYLAGTWKADPVHSEIAFSVRRLMISKTRGRFTSYDVTIVTSEDPLGSSVTATIDLASIDTGNEQRDNHLRSADYFDVEKHPTMGYRSTGIRQTDDGWVIDGELTLHGVSWQVPLAGEVNGFGPDPWGGQRAGFSATAHINRRDFGIATTIPMDAVDDKVSISLEIEAVLQK
jgi:polyisoprenoid-binding protein YceI